MTHVHPFDKSWRPTGHRVISLLEQASGRPGAGRRVRETVLAAGIGDDGPIDHLTIILDAVFVPVTDRDESARRACR